MVTAESRLPSNFDWSRKPISPLAPEDDSVASTSQALVGPTVYVKQVAARVKTGNDDKRNDSRVNFRLVFRDGTSTIYTAAVGTTDRWADGTWSPYTYFSF